MAVLAYAADRDTPSSAHLEEEQAVLMLPVIPATEPMLTMEPPPEFLISGAQV